MRYWTTESDTKRTLTSETYDTQEEALTEASRKLDALKAAGFRLEPFQHEAHGDVILAARALHPDQPTRKVVIRRVEA